LIDVWEKTSLNKNKKGNKKWQWLMFHPKAMY
jgi:hypothetical protein